MVYAILPAKWLRAEDDNARPIQMECPLEEALEYNSRGFNVYSYPNYPSQYHNDHFVLGQEIDHFEWLFLDLDMKHAAYPSKEAFLAILAETPLLPTRVIDSGNGIHAFWRITDLDAMSFLRLARRLARHFNTDLAVCQIKQLMRVPGTANMKDPENPKLCELLYESQDTYTCEQLDKMLPPITHEDEEYCQQHYDDTYHPEKRLQAVDTEVPLRFMELLRTNNEVKEIWGCNVEDRSKADFRLGHIMLANGFSKDEAMSVLVNSGKALDRAPRHRISYAQNIVDKVWTYEIDKDDSMLSKSVKDILAQGELAIKGTRFPCHKLLDDTVHGFRLGHVIGLVAGSGVGKTAMALNMFRWFTQYNPDYVHFFVSLEQPSNEIADRWRTLCQGDTQLHDKVHVLSNYGDDSSFRHLSLEDIREYILKFQKATGKKIGTVVIDHIGALKKQSKNGEGQALMDICHQMKSFAVATNTVVVMQSQAPREKAGIGDLELSKDAAYGTVFFESYVDFLLTIWQPYKRGYATGAPTIMAFKFCKIRHKKQGKDKIQEDVCYRVRFNPTTERLEELTEEEDEHLDYWTKQCTNMRKADRKTDIVPYQSRRVDGTTDDNQNTSGA